MRFPPQFLDQLRGRILTSEVVGKRVRLVRKGNEFSGLCPFHNEKTPSFTVNDDKAFYHCFGCGAHGDSIKFVMETMGLHYVEAVRYLAESIGMAMPELTRMEQEQVKKAASLYDVMEMACVAFQEALLEPVGANAREYLVQRGLSRETIATFRLGFAPDTRQALRDVLKKKGVSDAMMQAAGLQIQKDGGVPYDRFRGRVMFPITDSRNKVIAFGGRVLNDTQPKYLNSPETDLFKKGHVLYAMAQARQSAFDTGKIIVSEGYMDVIALHEAGILNAVAPLGTAVTESHLASLWRMAKEPVICLDGDQAGKRAMLRTAEMSLKLLKPGLSLRFARLPDGLDPDDIIKTYGVGAMEQRITDSLPLSDVLWQTALVQHPAKTPEQKAALEETLMQYAKEIEDKNVQNYYRRFFLDKLWEHNRKKMSAKYSNANVGASDAIEPESGVIEEKSRILSEIRRSHEKTLLAIVVKYPQIILDHKVEDILMHINISSKGLDKLRMAILETRHFLDQPEQPSITADSMTEQLKSLGFARVLEALESDKEIENTFFLRANMDIKTVELMWERVVALHHLSGMEQEYQCVLQEMTQQSELRAFEIKKQIDTIKQELDIYST